jgi:hypothetical protein
VSAVPLLHGVELRKQHKLVCRHTRRGARGSDGQQVVRVRRHSKEPAAGQCRRKQHTIRKPTVLAHHTGRLFVLSLVLTLDDDCWLRSPMTVSLITTKGRECVFLLLLLLFEIMKAFSKESFRLVVARSRHGCCCLLLFAGGQ